MTPSERVEALTTNGNVSLSDWDWLLRIARAAVAWREATRYDPASINALIAAVDEWDERRKEKP